MQYYYKLKKIIACQYAHWRRREWNYVKNHKSVLMFVFLHCRQWYTKLRYRMTFGEEMNMRHPSTFHEKLFWLSVNFRHPLIMQCADKYRVREYVAGCGCGDILNEQYGVYDNANEIEWNKLPQKFVIKGNRGSGDNFFCLDKQGLDIAKAMAMLSNWKNHNYGIDTAEYQYYKMPFKLVCEKFLIEKSTDEMMEYQFFCFNGVPSSILVRNDLETSGTQQFAVSYSMDWKREYLRRDEEKFDIQVPKPKNFEKMVECTKRLCAPFPHVRVDFYEVGGKLYFGELTFSTHGNVFSNYKESTLEAWNKLLLLPKPYSGKDRY